MYFTKVFKPLTILAIAFCLTISTGLKAGVHFNEWDFKESTYQAKVRKKPLFIFIGSKSCVESQKEEDVFKLKQVADLLNKKFVSNKYDTDKFFQHMKAINWGVEKYPTFIFFDENGKMMFMESGYKKYQQVLDMIQKALAMSAKTKANKGDEDSETADASTK